MVFFGFLADSIEVLRTTMRKQHHKQNYTLLHVDMSVKSTNRPNFLKVYRHTPDRYQVTWANFIDLLFSWFEHNLYENSFKPLHNQLVAFSTCNNPSTHNHQKHAVSLVRVKTSTHYWLHMNSSFHMRWSVSSLQIAKSHHDTAINLNQHHEKFHIAESTTIFWI